MKSVFIIHISPLNIEHIVTHFVSFPSLFHPQHLDSIDHSFVAQYSLPHTIIVQFTNTTSNMDRRPNHTHSRPVSSGQWSGEAVRGSWESAYYPSSSAPSPRDQNSAWIGTDAHSNHGGHRSKQTMVDQWLGQQNIQDYSNTLDDVSDLTTPSTSPAISDSATFASPTSDLHPTYALPKDFLTPPSKTSRWQQHIRDGSGSSSYRDTPSRASDYQHSSTENDLRGVGAFADTDPSRYGDSHCFTYHHDN